MATAARMLPLFIAFWAWLPGAQAEFQYLPPPTNYVNDLAQVLTPEQQQRLEVRLQSFRRRTGLQSVVLIVPSLQGDVLEDVAVEQFKRWGIGTKKENNGLLLFVAVEDRAVRIEVGYGLEDRITDAVASRIIREELTPLFRQQRFFDALMAYQMRTEVLFGGRAEGTTERRGRRASPLSLAFLLVFGLVGLIFQRMFIPRGARNLSSWGGINTGGFGGFGGFGGGFGGGGGFSGGGGMSGGGGASGSW